MCDTATSTTTKGSSVAPFMDVHTWADPRTGHAADQVHDITVTA